MTAASVGQTLNNIFKSAQLPELAWKKLHGNGFYPEKALAHDEYLKYKDVLETLGINPLAISHHYPQLTVSEDAVRTFQELAISDIAKELSKRKEAALKAEKAKADATLPKDIKQKLDELNDDLASVNLSPLLWYQAIYKTLIYSNDLQEPGMYEKYRDTINSFGIEVCYFRPRICLWSEDVLKYKKIQKDPSYRPDSKKQESKTVEKKA